MTSIRDWNRYELQDNRPDINVDNLNILNNNTTGDIDIGSAIYGSSLDPTNTIWFSICISGLKEEFYTTDTTLDDIASIISLYNYTTGRC